MSTKIETPPASNPPRVAAVPSQLAWLERELVAWQDEGIIDQATATTIRGRYVATRRLTLVRIVLSLGAAFSVLGLIWLVGANLGQVSPVFRFVLVVAIWWGLTALAEVLAARHERQLDVASPVVGTSRLLAAGAFGAVVFQAVQSLHVATYGNTLIGLWGLGVLLYAYAVRGKAPLVLGVGLVTMWYLTEVFQVTGSWFSFTVAALVTALCWAAIAALHMSRWRPEFVRPWRYVSVALGLLGLFLSALPSGQVTQKWPVLVVTGLVVATVLAVAGGLLGSRDARIELALVAITVVAGIGLVVWEVEHDPSAVEGEALLRAVVSVVVFTAIAAGYALLGAVRDVPALTVLATLGFVVFTTFQAFAVFAP
ncbi:MAG: hypothetical protein CSA84_07665, partial [Actinomycetales bacterium]